MKRAGLVPVVAIAFVAAPTAVLFVEAEPNRTSGAQAEGLAADGQIVFVSHRRHRGGVHLMNADGSGRRALTHHRGDEHPRFSADGKRITFDRRGDIFVMRADGTHLRRLTSRRTRRGRFAYSQPAFSPNGKRIVFSGSGPGDDYTDIYLIRANGSHRHRLSSVYGNDFSPVYSPDGTKIAFDGGNGDKGGIAGIYVMNADGSRVKQLTHQSGFAPDFSPDGSEIVYARFFHYRFQVYSMNVDGSNQHALTDFAGESSSPSFSVDGTKIAFTRSPETSNLSKIHVMNADGSEPVALPDSTGNESWPDWGLRSIERPR